MSIPRLGVNIDHVATLRQLRGTPYPELLQTARTCLSSGADQITVHLREDRRHIQPSDVKQIRQLSSVILNLEMGLTPEMTRFAFSIRPDWICLVPEKRKEVTTEGGLNLRPMVGKLKKLVPQLEKRKIKLSLFIEPSLSDVKLSAEVGADAIELHTGAFALASQKGLLRRAEQLRTKLIECAELARSLGVGVHAGHGLDYKNIRELAFHKQSNGFSLFDEFNIGHSIVCRAVEVGMEQAVREMKSAISAP